MRAMFYCFVFSVLFSFAAGGRKNLWLVWRRAIFTFSTEIIILWAFLPHCLFIILYPKLIEEKKISKNVNKTFKIFFLGAGIKVFISLAGSSIFLCVRRQAELYSSFKVQKAYFRKFVHYHPHHSNNINYVLSHNYQLRVALPIVYQLAIFHFRIKGAVHPAWRKFDRTFKAFDKQLSGLQI